MSLLNRLFSRSNRSRTNAKFSCHGIQYFNPACNASDEFLESIFAKLIANNKVYSEDDLDKISEFGQFECRECLFWFSGNDFRIREISLIYKFISVNSYVEVDIRNKIEDEFASLRPITRVDIQNLKFKLHYEIWDNCTFKKVSKAIISIDGIEEIIYVPI